jgi:hypothetical protein
MKRSLWAILGMVAVMCCCAVMAVAGGVPNTLNYQGTLTSNTGSPVTATKPMLFKMYTTSMGRAAFWSEQKNVDVKNGQFSVVLGSSSAIPAEKLTGTTYVGITVDPPASELLPRQKLTSVAYALKAADATPKGIIVMWSGAVNQIPEGWVLCDGVQRILSDGTKVTPPDLRDRFIVGAGSGAGSTYAPGAKSISLGYTINLEHIHLANDHNHVIGMDSQGSHQHSGSTGSNSSTAARSKTDDLKDVAENPHYHNFSTDWQGIHTHNAWSAGASDRNTDSRLSTSQDIRPPYYALAFIMKL